MRRALRKRLPALSYYFGLRPWDVDRLQFGEIEQYVATLRVLPWPPRDPALMAQNQNRR